MRNIKNSTEISIIINELLTASRGGNKTIKPQANNTKHDWIKKAIISFIAKTELASADPISQGFIVKPSTLAECDSKEHFRMQLQLERAANNNIRNTHSVKSNASRVSQRINSVGKVKAR